MEVPFVSGNVAQERLWAVACHEAGHAVIGQVLERNVRRVSIVPDRHGLSLGHTDSNGRWNEYGAYWTRRRQVETAVLSAYGGVFAERELTGRRHNWTGARADLERVADIALSQEGSAANEYLRWARAKARGLVSHNLQAIEKVAHALMERTTLDGSAFRALLQDVKFGGGEAGRGVTFEPDEVPS
jgi:ATP-dependent Zn protease